MVDRAAGFAPLPWGIEWSRHAHRGTRGGDRAERNHGTRSKSSSTRRCPSTRWSSSIAIPTSAVWQSGRARGRLYPCLTLERREVSGVPAAAARAGAAAAVRAVPGV